MQRIDDATAATSLPTPEAAGTPGYFTEGNAAAGTPATNVRGSWLNMVQEELMSLLTAAGITPSKTTYNQVYLAIQSLFKSGRLLRTSIYTVVAGVQYVSVNGAAAVTTGASTFTSLAATAFVDIEAIGGGGGGGGVPATSSSQVCLASGGSAGSYGRGVYYSGFSSLAITVGTAGVGGALGNNAGTQGGTSSAGALLSCPGGPPGVGSGPVSTGAYGTSNVPPGRANLPTGANVLLASGAPGFAGTWAGGSATPLGGTGGSSVYGAGGNSVQGSAGAVGIGYGAGGSGAAAQQSAPGYAGGNANSGVVIIREYA